MMLDENILKTEERIMYTLRSLYHKSGYTPFKMSRFEEYDMYVRNKNFMGGSKIISFTDLSGRLLALKPDVTLSIIKNYKKNGGVSKVYYNENVYRPDNATHEIKEIMQSGIECMGDIGAVEECEVLLLAIKSLEAISDNYILDISSVGIVTGLLNAAGVNESVKKSIIKLLGAKNTAALRTLCEENGVGSAISDIMIKLCEISGDAQTAIEALEKLCINREMMDALSDLKALVSSISRYGKAENLQLDFSIIDDTNYYNGVVFRGYVDKLPGSVLSGGRYDNLLKAMGKDGGAIGFAVYSDMLERIDETKKEFDCDVLLVYNDEVDVCDVLRAAGELKEENMSVNIQKSTQTLIRAKKVYKVVKGGEVVNG